MKKITLFAVAALAISFASCKKERTCECTYTNTGSNVVSHTSSTTLSKIKKSEAKTLCQKQSSTYNYSGGSSVSTSDCKLK